MVLGFHVAADVLVLGGPLTPVSLLPPHLGVLWSLLLFGDKVKAASVVTLQGRSLPAPKGRPGWAEVARQVVHCLVLSSFIPFYVSASWRGVIWKSKGSTRTKAPRVDCGPEGQRMGRRGKAEVWPWGRDGAPVQRRAGS